MNTDALLLGIDVGTTNCKALLFDPNGCPQAVSHAPTPTYHPQPNWAEHDPEALWNTVAALVRQVIAGIDPARVRGVAVASMAEAGVLLDGAGRPTYPIIAWHDNRTLPYHRQWIDQVDTRASFAIAGMRPDPIYGVYKLMWLRDHASEAYRSAVRWLHVADYIAFRLCGVPATDPSLATRTMLFDLQGRSWSDRLVDWAHVRGDVLPEVVPSGTALGGVTAEAAATTGLQPGTVVASGGHDHVCGAFAADVREPGTCLDSLGTAEAVFLPLASVQLDDALSQTGCTFGAHVARDRYYTMDGLWSGGGAIEWARSMLALPTTIVPAGDTAASYAHLEATAAQIPAGSLGVFFLPRLAGGERGAFIGLTGGTSVATLARAVYEGLAYEWRRYLDMIESALHLRAEIIKLIGGGTRSALWVQIKADVLGRPLHVLNTEESVALGAAMLAGLAAGIYRDEAEAVACLHHDQHIVEPNPVRTALYDRWYHDVFLQIAPALSDVHRIITNLPLPHDAQPSSPTS